MGKPKKKGTSGAATAFLTKKQACRKLQLSLSQFRKFCILKGIFPREVRKHPKGKDKTYFYFKDVNFLLHDPLLQVFRERTAIKKKIKKAESKGEKEQAERLKAMMPEYNLDHIVKERYPTFIDALRDLDDAISMIYLFASLRSSTFVPMERVTMCERICREFEAYLVKTHSLTKVFVSVKGVYYQAEVFGQKLTWLVPHGLNQKVTKNADYKVMLTFLELYETLMGFVLYRLYNSIGITYPPKFQDTKEEDGALDLLLKELEKSHPTLQDIESKEKAKDDELTKKAKAKMAKVDTKMLIAYDKKQQEAHDNQNKENETTSDNMELDDEFFKQKKEEERFKKLFDGKKIFLSREVPRYSLEFVVRCFGGIVSWDGPDAPLQENDESITHQIVDRSFQKHQYLSRVYVQPQWVFDSVNERVLLPTAEYAPTATPPAHLSPFVDDEKEGYKPKRREQLDKIKAALANGETFWNNEAEDSGSENEEESKEVDLEEQYKSELKAEMEGKSFEELQMENRSQKRKRLVELRERRKKKNKSS